MPFILAALPAWGQSFEFLDAPGILTAAHGVSADGAVVVGSGRDADLNWEPSRWTETGQDGLGFLSGGRSGVVYATSADGAVSVGYAQDAQGYNNAVRWAGGPAVLLGALGRVGSRAYAASADGSVVVGAAATAEGPWRAFRWTADGGMVNLGILSPGSSSGLSRAHGVSADGAVVVGESGGRAFRWTADGGMAGLGTLGGTESVAYAVSADGSVIVGSSKDADGSTRAFRWTSEGGMRDLGALGGPESIARAVSADGSVVVGIASRPAGSGAFIWTPTDGIRDLERVLEDDYGLDLTGHSLGTAHGLSADGAVIVGSGFEQWVGDRGWRAVLRAPTSTVDAPLFPAALALRVYPNPARDGGTTVAVAVSEPGPVTLAVFDALGRRVIVLHDGALAAGELALPVDTSALPPGVYVVRAEGRGGSSAVRVVVAR